VGVVTCGIAQRIKVVSDHAMLHVPLTGTHSYRLGTKAFDVCAGEAILLGTGVEYAVINGGPRSLSIMLNPGEWEAVHCALFSDASRPRDPVVHRKMEPVLKERRWDMFDRLQSCSDRGTGLDGTAASFQLVDTVARWSAPVSGRNSTQSALRRLAIVEDWIDAHLSEPMSRAALCAVAGIGGHGLQKSFHLRHGKSPMEWVRQRRMARARSLLVAASDDHTVTKVMGEVGLTHPGRFSIAYAHRYGEHPTNALAKRLGKLSALQKTQSAMRLGNES
jgi:AraC-like DNA-binding protein